MICFCQMANLTLAHIIRKNLSMNLQLPGSFADTWNDLVWLNVFTSEVRDYAEVNSAGQGMSQMSAN